jgi:2-succinyl-6-hydroxy-2,4-cyclohexadiene-1-carboxylate synthase
MLHGFAGTARHWDRVLAELDGERYSAIALELAQADPLSFDGARVLVERAPAERFVLCGYSMGGRIALNIALALPQRVSRLVLVSSSPGIDDASARAERLAADEQLARDIEVGGVESFIARWRRTELFATDPEWVQQAVAEDTRRLTAEQIAGTLRAYSSGRLDGLADRLDLLTMPVVVLAGARDRGYCAIGRRIARAAAQGEYIEVPGVGHRLTIEAPASVAAAIG